MNTHEAVLRYHDETKHHPHRYARSLGYLDWDTQPDPFRRFLGAPLVPLPIPNDDDTPPYGSIRVPGQVAPTALSLRSLSRFFECSLAISAWKQAGPSRWALRCNPSSGNLHPTEGYLVAGPLAGLGPAPGVYHYAPKEHVLEQRTTFAAATWDALVGPFPPGAFLVGLSSVHWREAWKYGERAFRYCNHDVGHALGALRFAAAMLGWRLAVLDGLGDDEVARVLGLDRPPDFDGAEREHPDLLAVVFPEQGACLLGARLDPDVIATIAGGAWAGSANQLSPDHVDWPIIDEVAAATWRKAASDAAPISVPGGRALADPSPAQPTAREIIRQRRSAVAFDGVTAISADTFFRILSRVVPGGDAPDVPWDCIRWTPAIDLLLFVHRVTGLPPGLYALVRSPARHDRLRQATRPNFAWSKPADCPDALPLYLLDRGDGRQAAESLSLGQAIAGDGAFSLGMIADFARALEAEGPWFYRRLYWEAGLVGQVLYLEAEAAGIRATGIGAYFDEPVHALFGLTGHAFQSMYHFTMGGPIDDVRLTTLPGYAPRRKGGE